MSKTITAYKDCKGCIYLGEIDKYYMHCKIRDKKYMYGQSVPCDDKEVDNKKLNKNIKKKEKEEHEN